MKNPILLFLFGIPLLAACVFDVPITTDHVISIDQTILGVWESVPTENDDPVQTRIFQYSETEYLVHYLEDDWDIYFRAFPINIGGVSAIQLEVLGDKDEAVEKDAAERYMIATYRLLDNKLEVRTLNSDLVSPDIKDSELLRAAFLKHKENPGLFNDPGLFKRLEN